MKKRNLDITEQTINCFGDLEVDLDKGFIEAAYELWFDVDRYFGTDTRDRDDTWINFYTRWHPDRTITAKKKLLLLVLTAAVGCSTFGLTMAYMTDSEQNTNVITVGDVTVDLTETKWNPENGKDILPLETVEKNPQVTNTGSVNTWIFLKVKNPKKNIITVNNTSKRKNASANVELFSFTANSKWELLSKTESDSEVEYLYGYKDVVTPGQTTQSLFDSVTAVNYMEGSLGENDALNIPIEAMAIQWNVDKADVGLKKIYDYYLNQKAVNDKEGI